MVDNPNTITCLNEWIAKDVMKKNTKNKIAKNADKKTASARGMTEVNRLAKTKEKYMVHR
ncbi:hypothetical protein GCM10027155_09760 [Acinetobacter apis]